MTIVGIRKSSFKGDDGSTIKGVNIYVTYPMEGCDGVATERLYLTEKRLGEIGYEPALGDEVKPEYNRFGKVAGLELVG